MSGPDSEFHPQDLAGLFEHYFGPSAGIKPLLDQEIVGVETSEIQATATEALVGALTKYSASCDPEWKPTLQQLVRLGAYIHWQSTIRQPVFGWDFPVTQFNNLVKWFYDAVSSFTPGRDG